MTACSAHKTLPVLTGGAWLNLADGKYAPFARDAMALFASTSPSYLILTSLDLCTRWAHDQARPAMQALQEKAAQVRCLAEDWGFVFPQGRTDPVRLALDVSAYGISGETAAEHFRGKGWNPSTRWDACDPDPHPDDPRGRMGAGGGCFALHAPGESRKGIYLSAAAAAAGGVFSAGSRPAAVGTDPFGAGGGKDSGGSGLPVPAGDPRCDAGGARYPGSGRVPAKV